MAKADWCTVAPMSGNGDGTLTISAPAHTGRVDRSTTVTVTAANGTKPSAAIQVNQTGSEVMITMDSTHPDVPGSGGTVTINGTSNSETLGLVSMLLALPGITGNLRVNDGAPISISPINGMQTITIPGDPGATGTYRFTITLDVPRNPLTTRQPLPLQVSNGNEKPRVTCTLYLLPGASAISVGKSSLALSAVGGNDTVEVNSNDDWTVS